MDLSAFRDPEIARGLIDAINADRDDRPRVKIMEVCGTHTVAIAKNGLRAVMPENVTLLSGPGCPVCVTANEDIDIAIELAKQPDVDRHHVRRHDEGPRQLLARSPSEKAEGRDVRIVYSPLDALAIAENEPDKQVVFVAVGFETTVPLIAAAILRAKERASRTSRSSRRTRPCPQALGALVNDPEVQIDALHPPRPRLHHHRPASRTGSSPRSTTCPASSPASSRSTCCRAST